MPGLYGFFLRRERKAEQVERQMERMVRSLDARHPVCLSTFADDRFAIHGPAKRPAGISVDHGERTPTQVIQTSKDRPPQEIVAESADKRRTLLRWTIARTATRHSMPAG